LIVNEISRARLASLLDSEQQLFTDRHPRSAALYAEAQATLLGGVPMQWMVRWAGRYPIFVESAQDCRFTCVDGREYLDFCLGDSGAMGGHSAAATVEAMVDRVRRGLTFMLPTEDAVWCGQELTRRFGLTAWQFALTATDANRFAIRLARQVTGRPKVLVYNWCYHGSVDETFARLDAATGEVRAREGNIGPPVDPALTTRVVEFNDVEALEAALAYGDVACVLAEPVMTNIGIVHPEPGYHAALRELTRKHGTLLILDETHTICAGPGGYTRTHGLEPDILTIGKPIAGGIPAAAYGFSSELAVRVAAGIRNDTADTGGIGGTLAGNALSLAAMRATLGKVLTDEAFVRSISLAERFAEGVAAVIAEHGLPWHVNRLGCRVEYWFCPSAPRNGAQAAAAVDAELDRYMHLAALNRGILLTPFHNMALIAPSVTEADVDRHTEVFRECVEALLAS
jgi:glutamate-1-semialdehyde 2,1-aminomutase